MAAISAVDILICMFLNESFWISNKISLKYVPLGLIDNKPSQHGSDNGLSPNRRQAIIWTNDGIIYLRIYASLAISELICNNNNWRLNHEKTNFWNNNNVVLNKLVVLQTLYWRESRYMYALGNRYYDVVFQVDVRARVSIYGYKGVYMIYVHAYMYAWVCAWQNAYLYIVVHI